MKKSFFGILLIIVVILSLAGCTKNIRAKQWGGTANINLPAGQKLVNATWKDADLWYLTRPMHADDSAEVYTFSEESSFGVFEGTYIISETK